MERLFKALIVVVVVAGLLLGAAWLRLKRQTLSDKTVTTQPSAQGSRSADNAPDDPCREAVVLTLQSHSGVSGLMTAQTLDGEEMPTQDASAGESQFVTACYQPEGVSDPDGPPQTIKICKPTSFVLHISGNGKGVFDLQAKPLSDVGHPVRPLLLCDYVLDSDRSYDWVLSYQRGSRPAVFLLGSKGDPNVKP